MHLRYKPVNAISEVTVVCCDDRTNHRPMGKPPMLMLKCVSPLSWARIRTLVLCFSDATDPLKISTNSAAVSPKLSQLEDSSLFHNLQRSQLGYLQMRSIFKLQNPLLNVKICYKSINFPSSNGNKTKIKENRKGRGVKATLRPRCPRERDPVPIVL